MQQQLQKVKAPPNVSGRKNTISLEIIPLLGLPDKACVTFRGLVLSQSLMRDLVRVPLRTPVIFGSLQLHIVQIYAARARFMLKIMLCSNIQSPDFMSFSDLFMQNSRLSDNTIFWT